MISWNTSSRRLQRAGQRHDLVVFRRQRAVQFPRDGPMRDAAGSGDAKRAGLHRLKGQSLHPLSFRVGGNGFVIDAAIAHHIDAQRRMRHLGSDIDGEASSIDGVHVLGEAFPLPGQAFVQGRAGDIFDALKQFDQPAVCSGRTGAKPTPQLPMTMEVTPFSDDGSSALSHDTCPS